MQRFEYRVIPAPQRGEKAKGAKTSAERFALALMHVMNDLGRDGWEYLRADTLPCEERVGLTGKTSAFQHMLVFRRSLPAVAEAAPVPIVVAPPPPPEPAPLVLTAAAQEGAAPRVMPFVKQGVGHAAE